MIQSSKTAQNSTLFSFHLMQNECLYGFHTKMTRLRGCMENLECQNTQEQVEIKSFFSLFHSFFCPTILA